MRALLILLFAASTCLAWAQSIEREVVASGGGSHTDPALILQWTIGEVAVSEASFGGSEYIEGFQQPVIDASLISLSLHLMTDGFGSETSWEIVTAGTMTVVCSGSGYPDNSTTIETCDVPAGCYILRVFDSGGDGMCCGSGDGGYVLYDDLGNRIIDNAQDGAFTFTSAISSDGTFCVPLGTAELLLGSCDDEERLISEQLVAMEDPAVSAEFGGPDATTSGYQFWMFDPDGTYSRRIFLSHAAPQVGSPPGATAAAHMRPSLLLTSPPPTGVLLNVRIRSRVAGVNSAFGPTCRMKIDPVAAACPTTQLIDDPNHIFYSCGVTRTFGGSDKVVAWPVAGANKYKFRFENAGEGYARNIAGPSYARTLNWFSSPLEDGVTYDVSVAVSFNAGSSYCPFGPVCPLTISNTPTASSRMASGMEGVNMTIYPNPNRGDVLNISIYGSPLEIGEAELVILDLLGRSVHSSLLGLKGSMLNRRLQLDPYLSNGVYIVRLSIGGAHLSQQLIVH